jgi:hypothetical protein
MDVQNDLLAIIAAIGGLSGIISPIIVGIFNSRAKRNEQEFKLKMDERDKQRDEDLRIRDEKAQKKIEAIILALSEKFGSLEQTVNNMDNTVQGLVSERELKKKFSKYTTGIIDEIVEKNFTLQDFYKNALNSWGYLMKAFLCNFHSSPSRYDGKQDRRRLVADQKRRVYTAFEKMLDTNDVIRLYKGDKVKFSQFLRKMNAYASFESLCLDLERNGLENNELIEKFGDQVDKFAELIITSSITWKSLDENKIRESA